MHEKDIKRYDEQMSQLDTNGFFMMPDGTKSSEHKNPKAAKKRAKKGEDKPEKAKKQKTRKENNTENATWMQKSNDKEQLKNSTDTKT